MKTTLLCGVGPAVLDQRIQADSAVFSGGTKTDVQIRDSVGGGCANALRSAQRQGVTILPVLLVGRDPVRRHLEELVKQEFPQSSQIALLRETRRSVICDDSSATVRSEMLSHRLPESTQQRVRAADLLIMAPMTEHDTQFVADTLRLAKQSVLLLSGRQLSHAETAAQLSRMATWTIINRRELASWTGCESLDAGLIVLQGLGVGRVLVTSAEGVTIMDRDNLRFQDSTRVEPAGSTVGAGDVFAGTFAACFATGHTVAEAVRMAQTAAAEHLTSGDSAVCNRPVPVIPATAVKTDLPPLPFRARKPAKANTQLASAAAVTAVIASAVLAILVR